MKLFRSKNKHPESDADASRQNAGTKEDKGLFTRLRERLSKTRTSIAGRLDRLILGKKEITPELLDELEEILFTSDLGVETTQTLIDMVQEKVARKSLKDPEKLKATLKEQILNFLQAPQVEHLVPAPGQPLVIMVVGVNGVGKTTTIGKAASLFKKEGKSVMLVAADTFRAAAIEQLEIWAERVGADFIKQHSGPTPLL